MQPYKYYTLEKALAEKGDGDDIRLSRIGDRYYKAARWSSLWDWWNSFRLLCELKYQARLG